MDVLLGLRFLSFWLGFHKTEQHLQAWAVWTGFVGGRPTSPMRKFGEVALWFGNFLQLARIKTNYGDFGDPIARCDDETNPDRQKRIENRFTRLIKDLEIPMTSWTLRSWHDFRPELEIVCNKRRLWKVLSHQNLGWSHWTVEHENPHQNHMWWQKSRVRLV